MKCSRKHEHNHHFFQERLTEEHGSGMDEQWGQQEECPHRGPHTKKIAQEVKP